ncbi:Tyrosine-sulfated glycopeptide receptor 1 [Platanthera guangdongensis]|uniref:Tyrosine-sulfated glycopeptide receptor 1 n=1 Tax=Platanthera guangdongensis TaxID=2320717 RepID=A0ABR2LHI7_9ASPA
MILLQRIFFLSHLFIFVFLLPVRHEGCSPSAKTSLLVFRSNITFSFNNTLLPSWVTIDDCCKWEGISCDGNGLVTGLSLPIRGLGGKISSSIAGLPHLALLNLSHNRLTGSLPPEILLLPSLIILDLSFNRLSGEISPPPPLLGNHSLQVLNLSANSFTGPFPNLGSLAGLLKALNVSNNSFSGSFPSSLCSSSPRLKIMDLSHNQFAGDIPPGLSACSSLTEFQADYNNLSGSIPKDLFDLTSLDLLSLRFNQLSGILDGNLITKLSNLTSLDLSNNLLTGDLPASISLMPFLSNLVLNNNNLTGVLPPALANCVNLQMLNLRQNNFDGDLGAIDFSGLSNLSMLDLGNNNFTGNIPASLYKLKSLKALRLAKNSLNGELDPAMRMLQSLSYLSLSWDNLTNIEAALNIIKDCKNLTAIVLAYNFIKEEMPTDNDLGNYFQNLQVLSLKGCELTGKVPLWLSNLRNLMALDLSENLLTGPVPSWLGSLPYLFYLDFSANHLVGEIPAEITGLQALVTDRFEFKINRGFLEFPVFNNNGSLQYNQLTELPPAMFLQNNSLHGSILEQIGRLKNLHVLDLSKNNFSGTIPTELSNLTNLERLNLSANNLIGSIPSSLNRLHFLASFDVSYNNLEGSIPAGGQFDSFPNSSYEGNPNLCGKLLSRKCSNHSETQVIPSSAKHLNKKILIFRSIGICFGGALIIVAVSLIILHIQRTRRRRRNSAKIKSNAISRSSFPNLPPIDSVFIMVPNPLNSLPKNLTMADILKATNNFDQEYIIGSGGFGMVYRATLSDGSKIAIKRLSSEMRLMEREFRAEVEALSRAQHKNLVSLQGYCMHRNSCLLIYSYMENNSLDYWLHEREDSGSMLDWPTRLKIAQGTGRGLFYIHRICEPHIVHRDIKSSNILLNEEFQAHVADFGLSRLILPYDTHVTTDLVGTLGYIPPEYGQTWVATLRGDIYSFGVVLLELLTGRRAVDLFQPKEASELVAWVNRMRCQGKQNQVFDPLFKGKGFEEQMLKVFVVASMCVNENPLKRPTIGEVVDWLETVGADVETC